MQADGNGRSHKSQWLPTAPPGNAGHHPIIAPMALSTPPEATPDGRQAGGALGAAHMPHIRRLRLWIYAAAPQRPFARAAGF